MKRILAVTGTRADYGIYVPVFKAITSHPDLSLEVAVTGMHLLKEFGHTVDQIQKDGWKIVAQVNTMTTEDTKKSMADFVGKTTSAFADLFSTEKPDIVLVLGDRGEMLAAAIAATELGIPVAQLHAGERSGSIDDVVRNAITQLASIHFAPTEASAANVRAMLGDRAKSVHAVGASGLDAIVGLTIPSKEEICKIYQLDPALPLIVFAQHPDTTDARSPLDQLAPSLTALQSITGSVLLIGTNADAGGMQMNEDLQAFPQKRPNTAFFMSMSHAEFLSILGRADVLVGNSSSGIIEAASFGLPVINIGDRQKGREQSGNVIDVPYDAERIKGAIHQALTDEAWKRKAHSVKNIYGDGHTGERVAEILAR